MMPTLPCASFLSNKRDDEIQTRDRLVINVLIPCQRTISTQQFKLLSEVPGYDLYYSLTHPPQVKSLWA
jgi:hypothetical protein